MMGRIVFLFVFVGLFCGCDENKVYYTTSTTSNTVNDNAPLTVSLSPASPLTGSAIEKKVQLMTIVSLSTEKPDVYIEEICLSITGSINALTLLQSNNALARISSSDGTLNAQGNIVQGSQFLTVSLQPPLHVQLNKISILNLYVDTYCAIGEWKSGDTLTLNVESMVWRLGNSATQVTSLFPVAGNIFIFPSEPLPTITTVDRSISVALSSSSPATDTPIEWATPNNQFQLVGVFELTSLKSDLSIVRFHIGVNVAYGAGSWGYAYTYGEYFLNVRDKVRVIIGDASFDMHLDIDKKGATFTIPTLLMQKSQTQTISVYFLKRYSWSLGDRLSVVLEKIILDDGQDAVLIPGPVESNLLQNFYSNR